MYLQEAKDILNEMNKVELLASLNKLSHKSLDRLDNSDMSPLKRIIAKFERGKALRQKLSAESDIAHQKLTSSDLWKLSKEEKAKLWAERDRKRQSIYGEPTLNDAISDWKESNRKHFKHITFFKDRDRKNRYLPDEDL